ncbi:DUF2085 domain-containing protein [Sorangium sp. So ce854]|uniref:DUF2085 domain-containing protein n=1 Tax=Sorangium sp. So ce854 TaxID=3133322 RepID=UPI003F63361A
MTAGASGRGGAAAQVAAAAPAPAAQERAAAAAPARRSARALAQAPGALEPAGPPSRLRAARCALALLGALPWCIPLARSRLPLGELGATLDRLFAPMCHRLPERSLALEGVLMPLCSRCAGIFAGVAAGAAIARPRLAMAAWRPILIALSALMAADVVTQDLGLRPAWHVPRVATGLAFGYAAAAALLTQIARRPG